MLQRLAEHCENKPSASIHVVARDEVTVEYKMAIPALRARKSSFVDDDFADASMKYAELGHLKLTPQDFRVLATLVAIRDVA